MQLGPALLGRAEHVALLRRVLGPARLHRVVSDVQLVVVVHVLAEHEREAVDEVLHRGRRDVEDADAALLGEDERAAGRRRVVRERFRLAIAHAASSARLARLWAAARVRPRPARAAAGPGTTGAG